ncbi:MAG: TIM-barrel domain-containing protein [Pseudonocardiaceae bacterium]
MSDRPRRRRHPARVATAVITLPVLFGLLTGARTVPATLTWQHLDPVELIAAVGVQAVQASNQSNQSNGVGTTVLRSAAGKVQFRLNVAPGERFFGLGERMGPLALNGQLLQNWSEDRAGRADAATSYSPTPFLLSSRGYGLLLDTTAMVRYDLRRSDRLEITASTAELPVHVITGPDPAAVLQSHAKLVGLPPLPPRWGLGVWKCLIGGRDRVLADVRRLTQANVPLDAVWIYDAMDDGSGWGWPWQIHGTVPTGSYPDLPGLIEELHGEGLAVLGYLNPFLVPGRPGFAEAQERGYLVRTPAAPVFTEPWAADDRRAYLDFTHPGAVAWWQDRVRHALGTVGFDGAMQDYGEGAPIDGIYASGEPGMMVHNAYPVRYARAAREAAQVVKPGETVLFARAGYSGSQASVTGRFTGDQHRSWDRHTGIGSVLPAMLSGSISGWPYWGPDIAGFFDGDGSRDVELWTRWTQLGALSPVMRDMLGDQADPVGVFSSEDTLATFAGYARLHQALVPYLHELAELASRTGLPLIRPLWLAEPADPVAWTVEDAYLLGEDLLVAPVVTAGARSRPVYLPAGQWRDYWTGDVTTGARWIIADAPVQQIPLFVRAGTDLQLPPPVALGLPAR